MRSLIPCFLVFFVQVLKVPKPKMKRSLAPCHHVFFCFNVINPKDMTTRNSTPPCVSFSFQ
jgi:hypothetical protein